MWLLVAQDETAGDRWRLVRSRESGGPAKIVQKPCRWKESVKRPVEAAKCKRCMSNI